MTRWASTCIGLGLLGAVSCRGEPPPAAPAETRLQPLLAASLPADAGAAPARPDFAGAARAAERHAMVAAQIAGRGVKDEATLAALRAVPRHLLVPEPQAERAYLDQPLPIGHGQTISQPYIVGFMTEQLELKPGDTVLEIGTGSGYQAAILAQIARQVVSIEIVEPLARRAAGQLQALGHTNITVLHGDGYFGHAAQGPYDAIIVTAAAGHVPPPLIAQLKPGGRMVIPVGQTGWTQDLILVTRDADGVVKTRNLLPVRFVPLTRAAP